MPSNTLSRLGIFSAVSLVAFACVVTATGCGSDNSTSTPNGDAGPTSTGDGGTCATDGTGTISVVVNGLPAGVSAKVKVSGASSSDVTATTTLADKSAGAYTVTAGRVAQPDPIVRTLFEPTVTVAAEGTSFCLTSKQTVTVTVSYTAIAPSNKLWSNGGAASDLLAFAGADLGATGTPAAKVTVKGSVPAGMGTAIAFDKDGNLWTLGGTSAEAPLLRFSASSLGTSGEKTPDRRIAVGGLGCSPSLGSLAFDPSGALWVTNQCDDYVMRVPADKLSASGDFTPTDADKAAGVTGARKLAFDAAGNMWVSGDTTIKRFPAASLAAGQAHTADFTLSPKQTGGIEALPPDALAFDASGNLWVSNFVGNAVYKLTPSQLTPAGVAADVIPSVLVSIDVGGLVEAIAFDESGGLWLTIGNTKVGRLAPAQLTTSTELADPTIPTTLITSADLGYSAALAFFPAPAALPLYSRFE